MKKILAFGGSTSKNSINKQLATYASELLENAIAEVIDLNKYSLPMYSIDEEGRGVPTNLTFLSNYMKNFDGYMISLAEHNGSYTASFKSILDWLSRINRDVFNNKPILLMATSPGARGGRSVLKSAEDYFPRVGASRLVIFSLPSFFDNFSEKKITNDTFRESLLNKIKVFSDCL